MLIVGILMKNVPYIDFARYLDDSWASALRSVALTIILLRAGLGLDPSALRKMSGLVIRLTLFPGLAEMVVVAILSNLVLGFPWMWGFMLGFLVFAATPAVMVPCLLSLQVFFSPIINIYYAISFPFS
jgi:NhaP-type Na+/H+ or K+/H+ antiporter